MNVSKEEGKEPYMDIWSLPRDDDLDFFPQYKSYRGPDRGIVKDLRNGTYQLHMQATEYEGKWNSKERTFTATLKGHPLHKVPTAQKTFTASLEKDSAREMAKMYEQRKVPVRRRYLSNVMQYYDHVLLNDAAANSPAGSIMDVWREFVIPRRIKPVLKLREPSKDSDADSKVIEKNKEIVDKLIRVDDWYSNMGAVQTDPYFTNGWQEKVKDAFLQREIYGRACIVKENWPADDGYPPVSIGGDEYKTIPNTLKIIHPIEMGMTEVELYSGKMAGCWLHNDAMYLPSENMIYLVNGYDSFMIGAQTYGFSKLHRGLDVYRLYRRLMAVNFPAYLKVSASGMGLFIANTTGYPEQVRAKMRRNMRNIYRSGEIAVIDVGNVEQFKFEEIQVKTDVGHLVQLHDTLMRTMANTVGVPHAIVYDDQNRARATLIGRLTTFVNYQVIGARRTLAHQLSSQHYMPNFRAICIQDGCTDLLEKFWIDVEFEEPALETKQERIDRIIKEYELNPYTDEWLGKQLEDNDYVRHIDVKRRDELRQMARQDAQPDTPGSSPKGKKPGATGATNSIKNETGNDSPGVSGV